MLDFNVFNLQLDQIDFDKNKVINTINAHSYCVSVEDNLFNSALKDSDIILPDGIAIVLAAKFLKNISLRKIAGYDLFLFLMHQLNSQNGSVFFLGSSQDTLNKIKSRCALDFPNVKFGSYSPPYKNNFSHDDSQVMCNHINKFKPVVLFVGMTAPKQEKWVHEFKNNLNARNICCIGAVFDFYAGNQKRAPKIMISLGLEWFYRSMSSRRLFMRYFFSNPKFIYYILKAKYFPSN